MNENLVPALILLAAGFGVAHYPEYVLANAASVSIGERMIIWAIFLVGSVIVWRMPVNKDRN